MCPARKCLKTIKMTFIEKNEIKTIGRKFPAILNNFFCNIVETLNIEQNEHAKDELDQTLTALKKY